MLSGEIRATFEAYYWREVGMEALIAIGFLSLFSGYFYLFRPNVLIRLSRIGNRLVATDHELFRHRTLSGTVMLLAGLLIIYVGVYYL